MHPRTVDEERRTLLKSERVSLASYRLPLGVEIENIKSESVDSFVQPELKYLRYLLSDLRILPVEVRLLRCE